MEHRHAIRRLTKLKAKIAFNHQREREALITDVSKHGLFLDFVNPTLVKNTILDVIFTDINDTSVWQSRAMVVHASTHGTGVILENDLPHHIYKGLRRY